MGTASSSLAAHSVTFCSWPCCSHLPTVCSCMVLLAYHGHGYLIAWIFKMHSELYYVLDQLGRHWAGPMLEISSKAQSLPSACWFCKGPAEEKNANHSKFLQDPHTSYVLQRAHWQCIQISLAQLCID